MAAYPQDWPKTGSRQQYDAGRREPARSPREPESLERGGGHVPPSQRSHHHQEQREPFHDHTNIGSTSNIRRDQPPNIRNVTANRTEQNLHHDPQYSHQPKSVGVGTTSAPPREHAGPPAVNSSRHGRGNRLGEDGGVPRVAASSFDQLREEHVRKGTKFEDKQFLPNDSSLYFTRRPPYPMLWKRPEKICTPYKPVFVAGEFERSDVQQGELGDCWFVAAMSCICCPDNIGLLQQVIPPNQNFESGRYGGVFRFNFWQYGVWQEVIVDDLLPTARDQDGDQLVFVHSTDRVEFWPALMEKAYAKLYGSYEALKGGWMADSLTDMTGGVAEMYILRGKRANYPRNIVSVLFKALERHALIGCGINGGEGGPGTESLLDNGLLTGHAYSVTDLKEITLKTDRGKEPICLIRIRNPHGDYKEWRGHWGDRSERWRDMSPEDLARLGLVRREDGEFWMDFQDFLQNFDEVVICNLSPDAPVEMPRKWYSEEHHGRWVAHFNAGGGPKETRSHWANPQYILKLQDTDDDDDSACSLIVQLMQKDRRKIKQTGENYHFIGFVIYSVPPGTSTPLKKDFFERNQVYKSCDSYTNTRQVVKRFVLPPGDYAVIPSTYEPDKEADYYIRFFFEKGNVSEYADEPPERVEVPPPTPSPKHKEQEEEMQKFFYKMSGEDMEINAFELHRAVNEGLSKEPLHRDIGVDACKSLVSLMDVDNSGKLGYTEFLFLWHHLRTWKKTFLQCDKDNSGKMDSLELRTALASVGYKITNKMVAAIIFRYSDSDGFISLDDFLVLMARLMKIFNVFHKWQKDNQAVFTLEQWMEESLRI